MISLNEIDIDEMDELLCALSTSVYKNLYFVRKSFRANNKFLKFLEPRKPSFWRSSPWCLIKKRVMTITTGIENKKYLREYRPRYRQ